MTIKINNEDIRIRPSSIESFYGCAYQWGKYFLEGISSIPNNRASIGTGIHAGVEAMWNESIKTGSKEANMSMMLDAAREAYKEDIADGVNYGDGENENTDMAAILGGTQAFVEDIVPFTDIPKAVETFYKVELDHVFIKELGGTIDYLGDGTIADIKTSKRKSGPEGHTVQQSIYKYLAEANGEKINSNLIQQVVLKKQPEGAILQLEPAVDYSKQLVNGILDTLDLVAKDIVPIHTILRGNPKYTFCSEKFCTHYKTCPWVKGSYEVEETTKVIKL